jgi:uncharacterized protein (DUF1697 family)
MTVFACLLRAIGPVTHAKMPMSALRAKCEAAGFDDVSTYVATGNVLLRSDKNTAAVRKAMQDIVDGFGIDSDVFIRGKSEIAALVRNNPFPEASQKRPQRYGVCFFHEPLEWPSSIVRHPGREVIAPLGSHLCIDYGDGIAAPKLNIERLAGARMTQRNWNTVAGLAAKAAAMD